MATLHIFTAVSKRAALVAWLWQLMLERYVPSLYMAQLGDILAGPSLQQDSSGVCGFGPCGKVSLTSAGVVQAFGGLRWYKHVGWLELFKLLSVYPRWQTCPLLCYLGKESWPQDTHVLVQQVTFVAWLCQSCGKGCTFFVHGFPVGLGSCSSTFGKRKGASRTALLVHNSETSSLA